MRAKLCCSGAADATTAPWRVRKSREQVGGAAGPAFENPAASLESKTTLTSG